jgi:hypothetical protein
MSFICVHCDNQSAIKRSQNGMYNSKSKHIHRRHNIIKHLFSNGIIYIGYIKSKENITNPLTKGLLRELVYDSSRKMSLKLLKYERV